MGGPITCPECEQTETAANLRARLVLAEAPRAGTGWCLLLLGVALGIAGTMLFNYEYYCPPHGAEAEAFRRWCETVPASKADPSISADMRAAFNGGWRSRRSE